MGWLEDWQKRLLAQDSALAITATLVITRFEPRRTAVVVQRLAGPLELSLAGHVTTGLLWEDAYLLVNAPVSERLAAMLGQRDPIVASAAATILESAGLSARAAYAGVLQFISSDASLSARVRAVPVLEAITPFEKVDELEAVANKAQSIVLRRALQTAAKRIRTLESDIDGHPPTSPQKSAAANRAAVIAWIRKVGGHVTFEKDKVGHRVTKVDLSWTGIGVHELRRLQVLPDLHWLNLAGTRVTLQGLRLLLPLAKLRFVELRETEIHREDAIKFSEKTHWGLIF
jgi:hypothetical protein